MSTNNLDIRNHGEPPAATLARALGLKPLDRVQINSRQAIAETTVLLSGQGRHELPFYYFQRVVGDKLEVRSPGGCPSLISPFDVCDVLPGDPIEVQAMPRDVFLQRLEMPHDSKPAPGAHDYAPAHVLFARKDRWGRAEAYVWFLDKRLNGPQPWLGPLADADRARLQSLARRTVMPVMSGSGASFSADHGVRPATERSARVASALISAAMRGDTKQVAELACAGLRRSGVRNTSQPLARLIGQFTLSLP